MPKKLSAWVGLGCVMLAAAGCSAPSDDALSLRVREAKHDRPSAGSSSAIILVSDGCKFVRSAKQRHSTCDAKQQG